MIRRLEGTVADATETHVVVMVNQIGYLVGTTNKDGGLRAGDTITLHTHLAVRETALDLYGFTDPAELEMFELLLTVPKIGPKSALQTLNQASTALLLESVGRSDPAHLQKLSGLGKKTCENIVQNLDGKLDQLAIVKPDGGSATPTETDALDALIALGYDRQQALLVVRELDTDAASVSEIVTQALKRL